MNSPAIETAMNQAWELLRTRLFCEKTNLVYDSLSSHAPAHRFDHIPYPEEVARHAPNPAGWGTGMEDSMLNAGSVLEACILRARLEPEHRTEALDFARRIISGMEACATVHGTPGFVARSICPRDGKSCYINSSRDQFTLFVYGLWRFFHSEFATAEERGRIARLLAEVATYTERAVRPENGNNLLRLDGRPALVSQMLEIEAHEAFRLPMFYLAAWDVTREPHWRELYCRYAPHALEETLAMDRRKSWWNLQLVQMQLSLALAEAVDDDPARLRQIREAMRITAALSERHFRPEEEKLLNFRGSWSATALPWHEAWKMTLREDSLTPGKPALYFGLLYLKPWERQEFMDAFELMRAIGNLAVGVALCREHRPEPGFFERFERAAAIPDYAHHTSGGVCNVLHGWYLLRAAAAGNS